MKKIFRLILSLLLLMQLSACRFDVLETIPAPPALPAEQATSSVRVENQPAEEPVDNSDPLTVICTDSDQGDTHNIKGTVDVSYKLVLRERMGRGNIVRVHSNTKATLSVWGKEAGQQKQEVFIGGEYSFNEMDQVYYLQPDNTNGSVLFDTPVTYVVQSIDFIGIGNPDNGVTVIKNLSVSDQCFGNILIENSCMRGINNGHICPKGCTEGACIP